MKRVIKFRIWDEKKKRMFESFDLIGLEKIQKNRKI
jgi:hypothetical protein